MSDESPTVKVTDETFEHEVKDADGPVLVDFWAEWCGPCRAVAPVLEALASEYAGRLKVAKINVDQNPQSARQFGIRAIPTLLLFEGGEVKATLVGAQSKSKLIAVVEPHVA